MLLMQKRVISNGNSKPTEKKLFSAPGLHGQLPKDSIRVDDWDFYLSSPAVDGSTVYFGTGSGYFYALDASTGGAALEV
ncbi:MAG: PQQ-binding-like beta-propeller repeat protein [Bacteroidota bacterium]